MLKITYLVVSYCLGVLSCLLILAWPEISVSQSDVQFIQAFRQLGCDPKVLPSGALTSGCEQVKNINNRGP